MNQTPIFDGTLSKYSIVLQAEIKAYLKRSGRTSSGNLYNSIRVQRSIGDLGIDIFMEEYGVFIDSGLSGTNANPIYRNNIFNINNTKPSFPNLTNLKLWVKDNGIVFTGTKKPVSLDSMTYVIGNSIKRDGVKGTGFVTKAYEDNREDMEEDIAEAYAQDVVNFLIDI